PMGPPKMGPDGFPILPDGVASRPGIFMMMMPGRARVTAHQQTMQDLANRLTNQLNRPVIDNTRLTAKYDFVLTYAPDPNEGPGGRGGLGPASALVIGERRGPGPGPGGGTDGILPEGEAPQPLFGAIQSQLGLKLEPKKGDVDIVVIDKMEKTPTEN
ncbi:MAG TPA: TIGR03435 family protein, partial [Candidatus Solibacter sp.]|nr:TIGR03435 family protein [Candidatus Solibacter sp.]